MPVGAHPRHAALPVRALLRPLVLLRLRRQRERRQLHRAVSAAWGHQHTEPARRGQDHRLPEQFVLCLFYGVSALDSAFMTVILFSQVKRFPPPEGDESNGHARQGEDGEEIVLGDFREKLLVDVSESSI